MSIRFANEAADLFVPDGSDGASALARTTHLGIGAHADDLELLAAHGILECVARNDRYFTGVVITDGRGSSRSGSYANLTDDELVEVRKREQHKAATLGQYSAQLQLLHPSEAVKRPNDDAVAADLELVLSLTKPDIVYTHCLTDQHDTHVAVALRVLEALRRLAPGERPRSVLGCEVWRDLDWLPEAEKVRLPLDREELQLALLRAFDSQIGGGKRYDLAALGRRRAHATFADPRAADRHEGLILAMDLTPMLDADDPKSIVSATIRRFEADVLGRLARLV
jgi:LmbE family N-acetylglucosaminyl deacetylase